MDAMSSIDSILVTPLKRINVQGGDVLHGLKSTDIGFYGFGEAYFSQISANYIKAWKLHTKTTMNLIVSTGNVGFVFKSPSENYYREEIIGINNYARITVPPGIWFGFKGLDIGTSTILNISNLPHEASEVLRENISTFHYQWDKL